MTRRISGRGSRPCADRSPCDALSGLGGLARTSSVEAAGIAMGFEPGETQVRALTVWQVIQGLPRVRD
jgi:hypothetical protein